MTYNERTVNVKISRIELCDLILATTSLKHSTEAQKWGKLHDKLKEILNDFDEKNFKED